MTRHSGRPAAVFHKGLSIFSAIHAGASSVELIRKATGLPATTILRILPLLVHDDHIVEARMTSGDLHLTVKIRCNPVDLV